MRWRSPPAAPRPPSPVIAGMEAMGFSVTHLYGLTECYGPATICLWQPGLDEMPLADKAAFMARQGVNHPMLEEAAVLDPATMAPVPADGRTLGEVMLRGNTVMKGYLRNPAANAEAFAGGWFHTGDLGGDAPGRLYRGQGPRQGHRHLAAARTSRPWRWRRCSTPIPASWRRRWSPSRTRNGARCRMPSSPRSPARAPPTEAEVIAWCRERLAHFKCPKRVTFGPLPKTSTGKIQKFELRQRLRPV